MKKLLVMWIVNIFSLWVLDEIMDSMYFSTFSALACTALVLGVLNATLKPFLKLISLPINFMTFGLFSFVINTVVVLLAFSLIKDSYIESVFSAFLVSIGFSIISGIVTKIVKD